MSSKADEYFQNATEWRAELHALRAILLDSELTEEFKWRTPCYTVGGKNVLIVGTLKAGCTLSFFKGALLDDPESLLAKPGPNSRSGRVMTFTEAADIHSLRPQISALIAQAIEVEQKGLKVPVEKEADPDYPEELESALRENTKFATAFEALTPGRRRGYLIYFNGAKQSKSRAARIEKYQSRILQGKGMHDCVCGLSQQFPRCDGSHKTMQ